MQILEIYVIHAKYSSIVYLPLRTREIFLSILGPASITHFFKLDILSLFVDFDEVLLDSVI